MKKFLLKISAERTGKIRPVFGKNPPSNRFLPFVWVNFRPKIRPVYGKNPPRLRENPPPFPKIQVQKSAPFSGLAAAAFERSCTLGRALPLCPLSELHQQSRKLCEGIEIPALTRAKAGIYVTAFRNSSTHTQNFIANKPAKLMLIITYFADSFYRLYMGMTSP